MESRKLRKIVIENHIPYIKGVFDPVCKVEYLPADQITHEAVADADALIVRTRTKCNRALLDGSNVRIVATATIGTDHIDLDYCCENGIEVVNVAGCNAPAVAQYVLSSVLRLKGGDVNGLTLGIVGVGHVGSIVARWARSLGMNVLLNDPPRAKAESNETFTDLADITREADVITFHTPMTREGEFPTFHLADTTFFNSLKKNPIIINSARGSITDTEAWITAIDNGKAPIAVVDCWENEPAVNRRLLDRAIIATPHIAGYSDAGKRRATLGVIKAVASYFGVDTEIPADLQSIPDVADKVTTEMLLGSYDPFIDTVALKSAPDRFEKLRDNYKLRTEPITRS